MAWICRRAAIALGASESATEMSSQLGHRIRLSTAAARWATVAGPRPAPTASATAATAETGPSSRRTPELGMAGHGDRGLELAVGHGTGERGHHRPGAVHEERHRGRAHSELPGEAARVVGHHRPGDPPLRDEPAGTGRRVV